MINRLLRGWRARPPSRFRGAYRRQISNGFDLGQRLIRLAGGTLNLLFPLSATLTQRDNAMATMSAAAANAALGLANNPVMAGLPTYGGLASAASVADMERMLRELERQRQTQDAVTMTISSLADMVFRTIKAKNGYIIMVDKRNGGQQELHIVPEDVTPGQMIDTILTTEKLGG